MTDKEELKEIKKLADAMYYAAQYLTTDASRLHNAMDEYRKFIINEYHKEEPTIPDIVDEHFDEMLGEEPVSEDLGEYINELSKQFPEVSFAKLSRIAVRVSMWQKTQYTKNKLPKVTDRTELDEYAYQCAYDMSNDWAIENPTWHDVEDACKLGAKWQKEQFEKNRLAACDKQTEEEAEREQDFVIGIIENEHRKPTFDDAIKYGMRLQKENMMKGAVNGLVFAQRTNEEVMFRSNYVKKEGFEFGDKVKMILIKEE